MDLGSEGRCDRLQASRQRREALGREFLLQSGANRGVVGQLLEVEAAGDRT